MAPRIVRIFQLPLRRRLVNANAARSTGIAPGHLGRHAAFIEVNQLFRRDRAETDEKGFAPPAIFFGVALGSMERLFFSRRSSSRTTPPHLRVADSYAGCALQRFPQLTQKPDPDLPSAMPSPAPDRHGSRAHADSAAYAPRNHFACGRPIPSRPTARSRRNAPQVRAASLFPAA